MTIIITKGNTSPPNTPKKGKKKKEKNKKNKEESENLRGEPPKLPSALTRPGPHADEVARVADALPSVGLVRGGVVVVHGEHGLTRAVFHAVQDLLAGRRATYRDGIGVGIVHAST